MFKDGPAPNNWPFSEPAPTPAFDKLYEHLRRQNPNGYWERLYAKALDGVADEVREKRDPTVHFSGSWHEPRYPELRALHWIIKGWMFWFYAAFVVLGAAATVLAFVALLFSQ